jgi:hypothetical protein
MTEKPTLKIETVQQITLQDWDDFVTKVYGKPYSFQQQDGCKSRGYDSLWIPDDREDIEQWEDECENVSIPFEVNGEEMGVTFETWLNTSPEDTRKHFDSDSENNLFWQRNFYPDLHMIAKDLYSNCSR